MPDDEVDYVSGRTRVFGIVGHPIEQVRSPEMFTAEFRRRGLAFAGKRVMPLGAGGAGSAIGVAIGFEKPRSLRVYDIDATRAAALADKIARVNPGLAVDAGARTTDGIDILLNASPVGM